VLRHQGRDLRRRDARVRQLRVALKLLPEGLLVAAGLPTAGIDIYNTQDIFNWNEGPGFAWTLLLSPDELAAFDWVKANTPADAVFQTDSTARGVEDWAMIPAFAERRMAIGLPISMVPLQKYEQGSQHLSWLFETGSAETAHAMAVKFGIDYLWVGDVERKRHPQLLARLEANTALFQLAFRNKGVSVYRVVNDVH